MKEHPEIHSRRDTTVAQYVATRTLVAITMLAISLFALVMANKVLHKHVSEIEAAVRATNKLVRTVAANREVARSEPDPTDRLVPRAVSL
jgi:hypothetical protein